MARKTEAPDSPEAGGADVWTGLEEWANTPEFRDMLHREFPEDATAWNDPVSRRTFLTIAGATAALAGAGCSPRPASRERIYPYVRQPEQLTPGLPLFFATGFTLNGITVGVLAKSREGRPIKLEGNPSHPGSLGGIDSITQSSLLTLYDPDRSRQIKKYPNASGWHNAAAELRIALDRLRTEQKPIRILTDTVSSPTLGAVIDEFIRTYPSAKWIQYEPVNRDNVREGAKLAYGAYVNTIYDFTKALRVVSLDSDFLVGGPAAVRYARDFNQLRKTHLKEGDRVPTAEELNRLYVVESMLTSTGAVADHRLAMRSADIEAFARALARELGVNAGDAKAPENSANWITAIAKDLKAFRGRCAVIAGDHQPPAVHAIVHAINGALGNIGTTVINTEPAEIRATNQSAEFKELVAEMNAGSVGALLCVGVNPVFTSPADVDFTSALRRVGLKVHIGLYEDETAIACDWHINEAHYLETWGDGRAYDGTVSISHPLIAPLYGGRSAIEVLSYFLSEQADLNPREIVKGHWRRNWPANGGSAGSFESGWQAALRDGVIPNTAKPKVNGQPNAGNIPAYKAPATTIEVNFRPDPTLYDGRFANNAWLQELPKPITKLTWDNAIIISPNTAKTFGFGADHNGVRGMKIQSTGGGEHGRTVADIAELTVGDRKVRGMVWIQPGHVDNSATVYLGYGRDRDRGGRVAQGSGFNAYPVRTSEAAWNVVGIKLDGTGQEGILACTQAHFRTEGRRPARSATRDEFAKNYA